MSTCYNCSAEFDPDDGDWYCPKCQKLNCRTCNEIFDEEFDQRNRPNIIEGECWRCHTDSKIEHLENLVCQLTEASND